MTLSLSGLTIAAERMRQMIDFPRQTSQTLQPSKCSEANLIIICTGVMLL